MEGKQQGGVSESPGVYFGLDGQAKNPMNEVTCDLKDKVGQSCAELSEEHFRQRNCKCKGPGGRNGFRLFKEEK